MEQPSEGFKLVGFKNFIRSNPKSDLFPVKGFHHAEFWCADATNTAHRFSWGFGIPIVAKSDLSTGNSVHASYLLGSGDLKILFTAPYSPAISNPSSATIPSFSVADHRSFTSSHGLEVRAIALEVADAYYAFSVAVSRGAKPLHFPVLLDNSIVFAELHLWGDVVLRLISNNNNAGAGAADKDFSEERQCCFFLPGFEKVEDQSFSDSTLDFGNRRLDHVLINVPEMGPPIEYVRKFTGFHEFAEFTAEDVGTEESGLNTVALTNNEENVFVVFAEPVHGTKRKSQTQNFLEQNEGPGVQHLGFITEDIFKTLREMKKRSGLGGFQFLPPPPPTYFKNLKGRAGDILSEEKMKDCEELEILVDRDDQGTLLQAFTQPVGDRPTIVIEIIQRQGCMTKDEKGNEYQKGGCGGFGKGNVSEFIKSVEQYEKMLEAKQPVNSE